jgi:hypothetical protein
MRRGIFPKDSIVVGGHATPHSVVSDLADKLWPTWEMFRANVRPNDSDHVTGTKRIYQEQSCGISFRFVHNGLVPRSNRQETKKTVRWG